MRLPPTVGAEYDFPKLGLSGPERERCLLGVAVPLVNVLRPISSADSKKDFDSDFPHDSLRKGVRIFVEEVLL
jgi:hypothetical protein